MQERKTGDVVQNPARLSMQVDAWACENDESWESARLEVAWSCDQFQNLGTSLNARLSVQMDA